jgi:uncharacterized membrane protein YfcA
MLSPVLILYLGVGALAGILSGLLGLGGGLIIVPLLAWVFEHQGVTPGAVMHLALGTSMGTIVFTSLSSLRAHHLRGSVRWAIVLRLTPGILVGTLLGALVAHRLSTAVLKACFVLYLLHTTVQMLREAPAEARRHALPGTAGLVGMGGVIGAVSSLVGIGGGSMSVPFMIYFGVPVLHAFGTSAALGLPIALGGAAGYLLQGWGEAGLPAGTAGYLFLPALAAIAAVSVLTAPLGVALAHRLPVSALRRTFAALLVLLAVRMIWSVVF